MNSQKVVFGVLAGVAAGALLGLLFAPDKGSVIRGNISSKSRDYAGVLKNKFNDFVDTVVSKFDTFSEDVEEKAEDLGHKAKSAMG